MSKASVEVVDAEKAKLSELEGQLTAQMEELKALNIDIKRVIKEACLSICFFENSF